MSSGNKLALGAIAALAAVAAARKRGSRSSALDEKTIKGLADYFSGRTFPSAQSAQGAVFYRLDRNRALHGFAPEGDLRALAKQVPVHEVTPGRWKVGPPIDPKSTLLYQVRHRSLEPIVIEKLDKFNIRDYIHNPEGVKNLIETLQGEIEEHVGHHGTDSWGSPKGWTFNIKAHDAYYVPDWVTDKLGHEWVNEIISEYAQDEIENLINDIQKPGHPLYQEWFDGEYSIKGRSGGYLVLKHDLYGTLESDADLDYIDDFFAVNIFGHTRIGTHLDELVDLESAINGVILALAQRQRLEDYIEEAVDEFNSNFDDDYWEDYLMDTQDYTKEEVELLKQGQDPHDEDWDG